MRIFFGDDSSVEGRREEMGRLVAFGGIYFEEAELGRVDADIRDVLEGLGAPEGTEIKWSLPPDNWLRRNLSDEERQGLYPTLMKICQDHGGKAIVAVIDMGEVNLDRQDAFREAVKYVFERFDTHLSYFDDDPLGLIVADRPGGGRREEEDFLGEFLEHVDHGTELVTGDRVPFNLVTTGSRFLRHVQLADIVCGVTTAMVAGAYKYAEPVFEEIKPLFIQNHMGYVGGTGLKVHPRWLINLYHHVLGEDSYSRVAYAQTIPLPREHRPYAQDVDG